MSHYFPPSSPADKPKKLEALKLKYAAKDLNREQLVGFI